MARAKYGLGVDWDIIKKLTVQEKRQCIPLTAYLLDITKQCDQHGVLPLMDELERIEDNFLRIAFYMSMSRKPELICLTLANFIKSSKLSPIEYMQKLFILQWVSLLSATHLDPAPIWRVFSSYFGVELFPEIEEQFQKLYPFQNSSSLKVHERSVAMARAEDGLDVNWDIILQLSAEEKRECIPVAANLLAITERCAQIGITALQPELEKIEDDFLKIAVSVLQDRDPDLVSLTLDNFIKCSELPPVEYMKKLLILQWVRLYPVMEADRETIWFVLSSYFGLELLEDLRKIEPLRDFSGW